MSGFATLLGGGLAGLAGANAQGGAMAAQNEVLNNTDDHPETAAKNGGVLSQFGSFLGDQLASAGRGAVNMGNQFIGLMNANSGQTPPSDPNPLVQANDGNPPNTGASPVTPAVPVCDPPVCTVMPGSPGTPGYAPSNTTLSSGDTNGSSATNGAGDSSLTLPGMDRPVRAPNPDYPPNSTVVNAMGNSQVQAMVADTDCGDCSDIAGYLYRAAGGQGQVIEVTPTKPNSLNEYENGSLEPGQSYHQVYTDGQYVYDPRVSSTPIPKGDWLQSITNTNPGGISISVVKGAK